MRNDKHSNSEPGGHEAESASFEAHLDHHADFRSLRGAAFGLSAQAGRVALQIMSTALLARLLTPADYGLVAMVTTVTGFIGLFADPGLSLATIQQAHLTLRQLSNLFWISATIGIGLAVLCTASGPILAWLYGESRLPGIAAVLGVGLFVQALGVLPNALLRRTLAFRALAVIEITAVLIGTLAGLCLAWLGAAYWSLVALTAMTTASATVLLWLFCKWWPRRPARPASIEMLLAFARDIAAFNSINYFCRNADNFLIGVWWGATALGLYSRAYALILLPAMQIVNPIAGVATPVLSRLQSSPDSYRRYFCRVISMLTLVTTPIYLALLLLADEIVLVLLGSAWQEVGSILRVLSVAGLPQPILSACVWNYVCLANTRGLKIWGVLSTSVIVLSFFIGLPWGPIGVAIAYAAVMNLLLVPGCLLALKGTPVRIVDLAEALKAPLGTGLAFLGVAALAWYLMVGQPAPLVLITSLTSGMLGAAVFVWHSGELRGRFIRIATALLARDDPGVDE